MSDSNKDLMENLDVNKRRQSLFPHLDNTLKVCEEKFNFDKKHDEQRLKWGRLRIQAIQAYGELLSTVQLEQLAKDVELIKEKIGLKP